MPVIIVFHYLIPCTALLVVDLVVPDQIAHRSICETVALDDRIQHVVNSCDHEGIVLVSINVI